VVEFDYFVSQLIAIGQIYYAKASFHDSITRLQRIQVAAWSLAASLAISFHLTICIAITIIILSRVNVSISFSYPLSLSDLINSY